MDGLAAPGNGSAKSPPRPRSNDGVDPMTLAALGGFGRAPPEVEAAFAELRRQGAALVKH